MHYVLFSHQRGVFGVEFKDYPKGGRPPEIGDVLPLKATKVITRDGIAQEVETYLDGLYSVTHLVDGHGHSLFPEMGCQEMLAKISSEIFGHRIAIVKESNLPPDTPVLTPTVFCLH